MCLLEVKDFSFTYAQETECALKNISFQIEEGGFYLLCGQSGSGKTTLLRQLKTVLAPQGKAGGEIFFSGRKLKDVSEIEQAQKIGFVFQNPEEQFVTDKVWHELAFGLESISCPQEEMHIRVAELSSYFGITDWFEKEVSVLSGGQKQLVNLASVLLMNPKLLILDEPVAQLDPVAASDFLHTLLRIHKEMGMTILLSEHHLEEVFSYADRIFVMEQGKLSIQGAPAEVGESLLKGNHEMFLSMPAPMQISARCGEEKKLPYTVAMGRKWLWERLSFEKRERKDLVVSGQGKCGKKEADDRKEVEYAIEVKRAWFQYETGSSWLLKEASLSVKRGEIFALLGGNGVGKSTFLRTIPGILPLFRGKIFLFGKLLKKYTKKELFDHFIGVLPQDVSSLFVKETIREDLLFLADEKEVKNIAEKLHIISFLDRHPYDLSAGEQQKAALAKVLLMKPALLLLDEPTKSLDAHFKREFGEILKDLKKEGVTVFLVSHDIEFCAEYVDRAGLYFRGQVEAAADVRTFFSKNYFYTTITNRMARDFVADAIVPEDIIALVGKALKPVDGSFAFREECQEVMKEGEKMCDIGG